MATSKSEILEEDLEMGVTKATNDESLLADWIADIDARATNMLSQEEQLWKGTSIYKVPAFKRELNPKAFTPLFVSFGPFHYCGNPELTKMEVHKERAFFHFLKRENQPLQNIVQEIDKIITQLRDAYCCLDDRWKSDQKFLKMMVIDGCFMLELLQFSVTSKRGYFDSDPYFSEHGILYKWPYIVRDMLLIENQLPLFLLKALAPFQTLSHRDSQDIDRYINKLVLKFVLRAVDTTSNTTPADENTNTSTMRGDEDTGAKTNKLSEDTTTNTIVGDEGTTKNTTLGLHALDLFRQTLFSTYDQLKKMQMQHKHEPKPLQTKSKQPVTNITFLSTPVIRCAIELHEAGVGFKRSQTNSLKDMRFNPKTGKFSLPFLRVDDDTECSILNILAFEHLHVSVNRDVTTYVLVMDALIDSAKDVSLLYDKGLILNMLGSDEEVAAMFNRIAKEVVDDDDSNLSQMKTDVFNYCRKKRNKWRASLCHTYFRSPWSFLSLIGALLVIVLTFIQTVYAIRGK